MRTGPFSDPVVATLINRYFVPVHLDNLDGSGVRYGMPPGHEDAYFILETPELGDGQPVDSITFGWSDGHRGPDAARTTYVLDPPFMKQELLKFLGRHPDLDHTWPELARLEAARDAESRLRQAELWLDEGAADRALEILDGIDASNVINASNASNDSPARSALARARAYRLQTRWSEADAVLASAPAGPATDIERVRVAYGRGDTARAHDQLDAFLATHPDHADAGEAYYLRGWLQFRAGDEDAALATWQDGIGRHPVTESLFSQKAHLTLIRQNWSLDTVVSDDDP